MEQNYHSAWNEKVEIKATLFYLYKYIHPLFLLTTSFLFGMVQSSAISFTFFKDLRTNLQIRCYNDTNLSLCMERKARNQDTLFSCVCVAVHVFISLNPAQIKQQIEWTKH